MKRAHISFVWCLLLSFGCNDGKNSEKALLASSPGDSRELNKQDTSIDKRALGALFIDNTLPIIYLREQEFNRLVAGRDADAQIALEFCISNNKLTLRAWPGRNDGAFNGGARVTLRVYKASDQVISTGDVFLSTQKLVPDSVGAIDLALVNPASDQLVMFYPHINRRGFINYNIGIVNVSDTSKITANNKYGWMEEKLTAASIGTNPSPPGRFLNQANDLNISDQ